MKSMESMESMDGHMEWLMIAGIEGPANMTDICDSEDIEYDFARNIPLSDNCAEDIIDRFAKWPGKTRHILGRPEDCESDYENRNTDA